MKKVCVVVLFLFFICAGCMKWDYEEEITDFDVPEKGLFILCEGNFQYGNSTLSFYEPAINSVENELFFRANGMKLGDVAQSMCIYDNKGWIVVNNSHVIFAIDTDTFKEIGRIENLTSPRYIHFISDTKAYVSQIWDNRIFIVDPQSFSITGYIQVPGMDLSTGSTEQMVQIGKYVYCNCWSYQNRIIKIDSDSDLVTDELIVGIQPKCMAVDYMDRIWIITDGGYEGSPYGYETPSLCVLDPEYMTLINRFYFNLGDSPSDLEISSDKKTIYWINDDVWKMPVDSPILPSEPFIKSKDTKFYELTVNPENNEVYVADAIDYSQQGMVYRYSDSGNLIDEFYVGITPGAFCWK